MNSLPRPVALVVTPIEPAGAVVVVELAVTAVSRKYKPAPVDEVRIVPPSSLAAEVLPSVKKPTYLSQNQYPVSSLCLTPMVAIKLIQ